MAVPDETIDARDAGWVTRVRDLVSQHAPIELIIGNPVSLRGRADIASDSVRARAELLAQALPGLPLRLVDERLTTAGALRQLQEAGKTNRQARRHVDAQAAVGILEYALEYERRTGQPAGESL